MKDVKVFLFCLFRHVNGEVLSVADSKNIVHTSCITNKQTRKKNVSPGQIMYIRRMKF